jgi:hypothetical protein
MSEQREKLKKMALEIQDEESSIKFDANVLKDRKKNLQYLQKEYMKLSLEEFGKE